MPGPERSAWLGPSSLPGCQDEALRPGQPESTGTAEPNQGKRNIRELHFLGF